MHTSGILVLSHPADVTSCVDALESLPGVEVHHVEEDTGRMIVVLETASLEEQENGLRKIQQLEKVLTAALVNYRFNPESMQA